MTKPTLTSLLTVALAFATSPPALADDQDAPLYFIAYTAPAASMVTAQTPGDALFLFWGADGKDLVALGAGVDVTLEKDGQVLEGPFQMGQVRSAADIAQRYAAPSESRRLLATMAVLDGGFAWPSPTTTQTFATRLHQVLTATAPCPLDPLGKPALGNCAASQRVMADLLARQDANVAWAMYLGTRDAAPTTPTTYRLVARKGPITRVLGELVVSPDAPATRVPAVSALEDVSNEQQRCDTPGLTAHGTLAIAWDPPYADPGSAAVQPILAPNIAGYIAYGRPGPCAPTDATDLNGLARTASFDTRGELVLAGHVRLSDALVRVAQRPTPATDGAWSPTFASLTVGAAEVKALGLGPAQPLCVYVAAVDRAGQIGLTRSVTARVADFEKPPSPWDVRVDTETATAYDAAQGTYTTTENFALSWRPVTAANVLAHSSTVTYDAANNPTVRPAVNCDPSNTKRLAWAASPTDCADPEKVGYANLDISEYLVYRFEEQAEVERFIDTDGDGYVDGSERMSELHPGLACEPAVTPHPALVGRIPASATIPETGSNTPVFVFQDNTPSGPTGHNKGKVFWYLVAARGTNGWVGPMSAPIRGVFHDTLPADPPTGLIFGTCEPELAAIEPTPPLIALDQTDDLRAQGGKVRLYCLGPSEMADPLMRMVDGYLGEAPFLEPTPDPEGPVFVAPPQVSTTRAQTDTLYQSAITAWLVGQRGGTPCTIYAEVVDRLGRVIAKSDPETDLVPEGSNSGDFAFHLFDGCTVSGKKPIEPGQIVTGPIKVGLPPGTPATVCTDINYENDEGNMFKLSTLCGEDTYDLELADNGGGLQCYSAVYSGPNKVSGAPTQSTCVKKLTTTPPPPPALWGLTLPHDADLGQLRWKAPSAPIAGIILQIEERDAGVFKTGFIPSGTPDAGGFLYGDLDLTANSGLSIPPPTGTAQTWCVKARSLSAASTTDTGGAVSEWVGPLCAQRAAPGVTLPSYLPWPAMTAPPTSPKVLAAAYLPNEAVPVVVFGTFDPKKVWPAPATDFDPDNTVKPCGEEIAGTCYSTRQSQTPSCIEPTETASSSCIDTCGVLQAAAGDLVDFIAWRQSRYEGETAWGPWVQVSAVTPRPFCFASEDIRGRFGVLDPSFVAARFAESPEAPADHRLAWVDRFPHEPGTTVRYAFVRFGPDGQILETTHSQELVIPQEVAP